MEEMENDAPVARRRPEAVQIDVTRNAFEPLGAEAGLALRSRQSVRRSISYRSSRAGKFVSSRSLAASEIASSSANLVPDPIVKCVVWAASPISTMLSTCHFSFVTVRSSATRRRPDCAGGYSAMALEVLLEECLKEPDTVRVGEAVEA